MGIDTEGGDSVTKKKGGGFWGRFKGKGKGSKVEKKAGEGGGEVQGGKEVSDR